MVIKLLYTLSNYSKSDHLDYESLFSVGDKSLRVSFG